ncbi:hypothetical protein AX17_006014 [Amanita inopinata Kibby_2008]|nr:hypothetical protein AX17_006014 [Amanita inopinata Kibby_2008]
MAGFLRKKTRIAHHEPMPSESVNGDLSNTTSAAPLFARFATTVNSTGQHTRNAMTNLLPNRVVSSPMTLGSTSPRRNFSSRVNGERGVSREPRLQYEAQSAPRNGPPLYQRSTPVDVNKGAYIQQPSVQDPQYSHSPSMALPMTPPRQTGRSIRRVPDFDKPLPVPSLEENDPIPHNVSSVPAGRSTPPVRPGTAPPSQPPGPPPSAYGPGGAHKSRNTSFDNYNFRNLPEPNQHRLAAVSPSIPTSLVAQVTARPPVQQSLARRATNDTRPLPATPQAHTNYNGIGYNPVRHEPPPMSFDPERSIEPPLLTQNIQMRRRQAYDSIPRGAATTNGPITAVSVLRKDSSTLESKSGVYGNRTPSASQTTSYQNAASAYMDVNALGDADNKNEIGNDSRRDFKTVRRMPSRPKSHNHESGEDDEVFLDALEEPKQVSPALGAGKLPNLALNRVSPFPPSFLTVLSLSFSLVFFSSA